MISTLFVFLGGCTSAEEKKKADIAAANLPDLNKVFENYEQLEERKQYAYLARKIVLANSDLQSSELYVEAASLYHLAGEMDSAAILINHAIDYGMANPKLLRQFPGLEDLKSAGITRLKTRLDSLEQKLHNISNFTFEMRAIDQFWPYFEKARTQPDSATIYLKAYIMQGPPEIRDYYAIRYYNLENMYGQMINGSPRYYAYLKDQLTTVSVMDLKEQTATAMTTFKSLYPEAVFPKVFIVPGLLNSGGTASEMGLFIGGDMYGRSPQMPEDELNEWQKEAIMNINTLPQLILHELMHFQQNYTDRENQNKVLYKIIEEGVCDFLTELSTGIPLKTAQLTFLETPKNFESIKGDLQEELFSEDLSNWLYNGGAIEGRPHDLGYALGYLITKSYYKNSPDKKKALITLLNTDDMRVILQSSDYAYLLSDNPEI